MKTDNRHSESTLELRKFMDTLREVLNKKPLYGIRDEERYQKQYGGRVVMQKKREVNEASDAEACMLAATGK